MFFEPDQRPAYRRNREFDIDGRVAERFRLRRLVVLPMRGYQTPRRESLQENSLVLIGNDNRLIQNFENASICVSHSSFSVTRDEDRSFMNV